MNTEKFTDLSYPDWKALFFDAMNNALNAECITLKNYNNIANLFTDLEMDAIRITHFYADMGESTHEIDDSIPKDDAKTASYCIIHSGLAANMMNILRTIDYDCKTFNVDHPLGLPNSLQEVIWLAIKITTDNATALNKFTQENPEADSNDQQKVFDAILNDVKKAFPLPDHRPITLRHQLENIPENQ